MNSRKQLSLEWGSHIIKEVSKIWEVGKKELSEYLY